MSDLFTVQGIVDRLRDTILVDSSGDYFTNDVLLDLVMDSGREVSNVLRIPRERVEATALLGSDELALESLYGIRALNSGPSGTGVKGNTVEVLEFRVGGLTIPRGSADEVEFWRQAPAAAFPRVWNADLDSHARHTQDDSQFLTWGPALLSNSSVQVTARFMDDNLPYRGASDLYGPGDYTTANVGVEDGPLWGGAFRDWHYVPMYLAAAKAKEMEMDGEASAYYRGLYREALAAFARFMGEPMPTEGVAA